MQQCIAEVREVSRGHSTAKGDVSERVGVQTEREGPNDGSSEVDGKVVYRKEGSKRKEPTTQGRVGWNPRGPMGVPSGKIPESTEGTVRTERLSETA